jgi:hypothetical protein
MREKIFHWKISVLFRIYIKKMDPGSSFARFLIEAIHSKIMMEII